MIDGFGFRYNLCDPSMGFTSNGRYNPKRKGWMERLYYFYPFREDVLFHCASYAMTNEWVPQFTRVGFEKSRIPDHLYEMILTEYEEMKKTPTTPEACEPVISNLIC